MFREAKRPRPVEHLNLLVHLFWGLQKARIAAVQRANALGDKALDLHELVGVVVKLEKDVAKALRECVNNHPLWTYWMRDVVGLGEVLSGQLIILIHGKKHTEECKKKREKYLSKKKKGEGKREKSFKCNCPEMDIERFPNPSSLWKYAGFDPVDGKARRRKRGEPAKWNHKLKSTCYNVVDSMVKNRKSDYRPLYDQFKAQEQKNHGNLSIGWIENRTRRKVAKRFLLDLFLKWYELKGLTPPKPYVIAILGHTEIPLPTKDEKETTKKEAKKEKSE